jgi:RNA recognition motif-containing protein
MQETLNKMTASVRHGVLGPNDASRTIHECAGLLGLQLAVDIMVTTIVISGMRKKATENDIRKAFSVFGDVAIAAVAPNERGFGILRFTNDDAVDRAMKAFRTEEVVVEDVAVQLRVIKPGSHSNNESRENNNNDSGS